MGSLRETELDAELSQTIRDSLGFVPNVIRAQALLPRAVEAELQIVGAVLLKPGGLSRIQKERLLLAISLANNSAYCRALHTQTLRVLGAPIPGVENFIRDYRTSDLEPADAALVDFVLKLNHRPTWIGPDDFDSLRGHGFSDTQILESIDVTGLGRFLCWLADGLKVTPDFDPGKDPPLEPFSASAISRSASPGPPGEKGPYLQTAPMNPETFAPFALFRDRFGFIPNIFRAQTLRPDIVEAESIAVRNILLTEDILTRTQKEYILLVISARNLNTYCVAVHCQMLRNLGIPDDQLDQIAVSHPQAALSPADLCLLDSALKLALQPHAFGPADAHLLQTHGFTQEQILEAVVMACLTQFLNTIQMGLGPVTDFEPHRIFPVEGQAEEKAGASIKVSLPVVDEDADLVAQVRAGENEAFDELVRRHHARIYRTLAAITRNPDEAEDGMQNAFLNAFLHIGDFRSGSKFATWLTRIAINEGADRLRTRKDLDQLDDRDLEAEAPYRPQNLTPWSANPEQLYSKTEMRKKVERELLRLPVKYRIPVVLRDLEELTAEEAAESLNLSVPALKSRLLRGRLMLRDALAPSFGKGAASVQL